METIFSKIITGEIPCTKVYEDDTVLAFLDINPVQPGHTLVIPKSPSIDARETTPADLAAIMLVAQKIAKAQQQSLNCDGSNISTNCGAAAGQEVFHTHIHVIPRYQGDGVLPAPVRTGYRNVSEEEIANTLKRAL